MLRAASCVRCSIVAYCATSKYPDAAARQLVKQPGTHPGVLLVLVCYCCITNKVDTALAEIPECVINPHGANQCMHVACSQTHTVQVPTAEHNTAHSSPVPAVAVVVAAAAADALPACLCS